MALRHPRLRRALIRLAGTFSRKREKGRRRAACLRLAYRLVAAKTPKEIHLLLAGNAMSQRTYFPFADYAKAAGTPLPLAGEGQG